RADQPVEAIALHPKVLSRYEEQLCHLQEALAASLESGDTEGANIMRELIESVTVYPHETKPGGVIIELKGKLNALLGDRAYPNGLRAASSSQSLLRVGGLMVAEECFGFRRHRLLPLGLWRNEGGNARPVEYC